MEDSQEHKQREKPSRRDLQKERLWRRRLEEQRGSGLSVRAYCQRGGFGEALFYWWRREIAKRAGGRCGWDGLALPLPPEGSVPGALVEEVRGRAGLFSRDPVTRRKAQKQLAYRLPGRPLLMFLGLYVVRLGFLDGRPGLIYCTLRMIYEYMIDLKVKELRRREAGLPI
jgi:hypothetical protein